MKGLLEMRDEIKKDEREGWVVELNNIPRKVVHEIVLSSLSFYTLNIEKNVGSLPVEFVGTEGDECAVVIIKQKNLSWSIASLIYDEALRIFIEYGNDIEDFEKRIYGYPVGAE